MWTSYVRVTTIYRILRRSGSRHKHNQRVPHAVGVSAFWWPSGDPWSPPVRSSDGTVGPQTGPWDGSVATPNHTQLLTVRSKVSGPTSTALDWTNEGTGLLLWLQRRGWGPGSQSPVPSVNVDGQLQPLSARPSVPLVISSARHLNQTVGSPNQSGSRR
jgi:hypothetical protein